MLPLYEELMLLALDEKKGTVIGSSSMALPYGLTAAVILELLYKGKIICEMNKIILIDKIATSEEILDEAINIIARSNKIREIKYWIEKLANRIKNLNNRILKNLVNKGILKKEKHKFLFIPYNRYPENNPNPEQNIREKIQHILIFEQTPDERLLSLISLIKACELLNVIISKEKRKIVRKRIKKLTKDEQIGHAVSEIVTQRRAALASSTTTVTLASIVTVTT